jgi:hypothetical protein
MSSYITFFSNKVLYTNVSMIKKSTLHILVLLKGFLRFWLLLLIVIILLFSNAFSGSNRLPIQILFVPLMDTICLFNTSEGYNLVVVADILYVRTYIEAVIEV